ncbi:hypothetical protein [Reticulibacter mediterranei]|uniref:hypothetical protein n=1 Tax=Reticulibacter mediterranei TaxID=2778369 RepID=UPI001C687CD8|nr:hypothetical protein [Reticulibacter mediterranei]
MLINGAPTKSSWMKIKYGRGDGWSSPGSPGAMMGQQRAKTSHRPCHIRVVCRMHQ